MTNDPEEFAEFPGPKSLESPAKRAIPRGEQMTKCPILKCRRFLPLWQKRKPQNMIWKKELLSLAKVLLSLLVKYPRM